MTKTHKKIVSLLISLALAAALAVPAFAAGSCSVSANKASLTVGQTVTVSATFGGGGSSIGVVDASMYYDSAILQYSSGANTSGGNGTVRMVNYASSDGQTSLSFSVTFTAIAAGSSSVSVTVNNLYTFDESDITCSGGAVTVTVSEPTQGGQTSRPQSSGSGQSESTPEPDANPIVVTAQGKTMHVLRSLAGIELPEEFENAEDEIQGEIIDVARGINQDTLLVYLTEPDGSGGGFYVYNRGSEDFYPFARVVVNTTRYTLVSRPESIKPPAGWTACEIEYGAQKISAFQSEDKAYEGYYLVYAADAEGKSGFFLFDFDFGTMQRFVAPTAVTVEAQSGNKPAESNPSGNVIERILADHQILIIVLSLAALSIVMVVAYLIFKLVRRCSKPSEKKSKKREDKVARQIKKRETRSAGKVEQVKPEISSFDEAVPVAATAAATEAKSTATAAATETKSAATAAATEAKTAATAAATEAKSAATAAATEVKSAATAAATEGKTAATAAATEAKSAATAAATEVKTVPKAEPGASDKKD